MAAQRTAKNRRVWKKNPVEVGQPPLSATVNSHPKTSCDFLNVSGLAMRKNIRVE